MEGQLEKMSLKKTVFFVLLYIYICGQEDGVLQLLFAASTEICLPSRSGQGSLSGSSNEKLGTVKIIPFYLRVVFRTVVFVLEFEIQ